MGKGQVERQVKTLRKRLFEPMLSFENSDELNHYLAKQCQELMAQFKHPDNKTLTVLSSLNQDKSLSKHSRFIGTKVNGYELIASHSLIIKTIDIAFRAI